MSLDELGKGVIVPLFTALLLTGCSSCQEPQPTVSTDWSYTPDNKSTIVRFVPLTDGGALTATDSGDVYAIDAAGNTKQLLEGQEQPLLPRVFFNPTGETFAALHPDGFTVYDAKGHELIKLPHQPGAYKLVPGGKQVYSPEVQVLGPEERLVTKARILDHTGAIQSEWPVPGLQISRLTPHHLIYATDKELVKTTLTGNELWRRPEKVRKVEISPDGTRIVVNTASDSKTIQLYKENNAIGTDTLDGPVWNLAISPDGRYTAATSQKELRIYDNGKLEGKASLPLAYTVSVDINSQGETLIGGQTKDHTATVMLFSLAGTELWRERSGQDENAWRPEVRFDASGNHWLIRFKDRLAAYSIERSR